MKKQVRGKPKKPVPLGWERSAKQFIHCPDCGGFGFFPIDDDGPREPTNYCQCMTCLWCEQHFRDFGRIPDEIAEELNFCPQHVVYLKDGECSMCEPKEEWHEPDTWKR